MGLSDFIKGIPGVSGALKSMAPVVDAADEGLVQKEQAPELTSEQRAKYRNMIVNAESFHKKQYFESANRYVNYLRSISSNEKELKNDPYKVFCNEFWTNHQTLLPSIYFSNPAITVTPEIKEVVRPIEGDAEREKVTDCYKAAKLLENVLMNYVYALGMKRSAQRCIGDALVTGMAVMKFGWDTELKGSETDSLILKKDDLWLERFNPLNFLVDPECQNADLSDAKYVIFRYKKSTELLKKNPLYRVSPNLSGTSSLDYSGDDTDSKVRWDDRGSGHFERNTLYEIWDIVERKLIVFIDKEDKEARYCDWPIETKSFPCRVLMFTQDPEIFYPIPDFKAIEGIVITKTKIRRKMVDLFYKLNRIYGYDKNAGVTKSELQNAMDAPDGGLIGFTVKPQSSLKDVIVNLNDFVMNDSLVALQNIADTDIERMSGISDYQRGLMSETKRTATEMVNLASAQNLRVEYKKDIVVDFIQDCVQTMIEILQANLTDERVQKFKTDEGETWMPYDRDDIAGKYAVRVDAGSMVKQNPELKAKEAIERYNIGAANPLVDQVELTKDWLMATGAKDIEKGLNNQEVEKYRQGPAPQGPEPPKLSLSLKLETFDLQNPQVQALLKNAGVELPAAPGEQPAPEGGGLPAEMPQGPAPEGLPPPGPTGPEAGGPTAQEVSEGNVNPYRAMIRVAKQ